MQCPHPCSKPRGTCCHNSHSPRADCAGCTSPCTTGALGGHVPGPDLQFGAPPLAGLSHTAQALPVLQPVQMAPCAMSVLDTDATAYPP